VRYEGLGGGGFEGVCGVEGEGERRTKYEVDDGFRRVSCRVKGQARTDRVLFTWRHVSQGRKDE